MKKSLIVLGGFLSQLLTTESQGEQISKHLDLLVTNNYKADKAEPLKSELVIKFLKNRGNTCSSQFMKVHTKGWWE